MVITDFDPLREKAIIQELYRELLAQPIYIKWFERYKSSVNNAEANAQLCLDMDADIRAWIKNVMEAHAQYTQDLKTHSEETASTSDDDPAKALRKTIGRYNSLLVLLQGVIELMLNLKMPYLLTSGSDTAIFIALYLSRKILLAQYTPPSTEKSGCS